MQAIGNRIIKYLMVNQKNYNDQRSIPYPWIVLIFFPSRNVKYTYREVCAFLFDLIKNNYDKGTGYFIS